MSVDYQNKQNEYNFGIEMCYQDLESMNKFSKNKNPFEINSTEGIVHLMNNKNTSDQQLTDSLGLSCHFSISTPTAERIALTIEALDLEGSCSSDFSLHLRDLGDLEENDYFTFTCPYRN